MVQKRPIDEAIDHTNAVALSLGFSKITLIIERVVGIIKAPAIPSKNRIAITNSALSAKNIANETRPNKANPVNNAFSSPFIEKALNGIIKPLKQESIYQLSITVGYQKALTLLLIPVKP